MRGSRRRGIPVRVFASLALAVAMVGCQSGPSRKTLASAEPALSPPVEGGTAIAAAPGASSPRTMSFVERHPLFYKPRDYYESSGDNTVVKSAAAVVVGVPAGIYGELKQIVVGAPTDSHY
jgi:hypothetical protein